MAFFSSLSSTIGKKLLLYGLSRIDILDKDPTDFVSVDVGKRTTLEVRDVGLHVKKLVALLQVKLPPEVHLSKAKAALLRVTFVLDFGVPQISIELDGIQVEAGFQDAVQDAATTARPSSHQTRSPHRRRSFSPPDFSSTDQHNESGDDEHVPTVDELTNSFMDAEPDAELDQLKHELGAQSAYMQDSLAYGESGYEDSAGMGAPMALPTYLRNILNTALDRLTITINNINIEVEDQTSDLGATDPLSSTKSPATLQFHVERIAVDSSGPQRSSTGDSTTGPVPISPPPGHRRLHVQNVCARLVSDVENFVSMSRVSQPASPIISRSATFEQQTGTSDPSQSVGSVKSVQVTQHLQIEQSMQDLAISLTEAEISPDASHQNMPPSLESAGNIFRGRLDDSTRMSSPEVPLDASIHTVDEDRFADATSDDGIPEPSQGMRLGSSRSLEHEPALDDSSMFYGDGEFLEDALHNGLLRSQSEHIEDYGEPVANSHTLDALDRNLYRPGSTSALTSESSVSTLPTVSALGQSFKAPSTSQPQPQFNFFDQSLSSGGDATRQSDAFEAPLLQTEQSLRSSSPVEELAESQVSSSSASDSMYQSAMDGMQSGSNHIKAVPGRWESSSSSSKADSERSDSIPEDMVSGSILQPLTDPTEEESATPRASSPQSGFTSPHRSRMETLSVRDRATKKQAKLFLSIDEITVWFPSSIDGEGDTSPTMSESVTTSGFDFRSPSLGDDSIFAEMPGSFSNYAQRYSAQSSSHRRKTSVDDPARRHAVPRVKETTPAAQPGRLSTPIVKMDIGSVIGHMDLSTGRILFSMFSRVMSAISHPNPEPIAKDIQAKGRVTDARSIIKLSISHLGIAWLENVCAESIVGREISKGLLDMNPLDAILRIRMSAIRVISETGPEVSEATLQIGEFVIACLDQDVIAFQKSPTRAKHSVSNTSGKLNHDVHIDFKQATDKRITIITKPVNVVFDIQKLDEALGCFGGFSGVLELSSSISSSAAAQSPVVSQTPLKPRGVHFGDRASTPVEAPVASTSTAPKIQIETGDVAFTLKGKTCAVRLQTTSIRAAIRAGNVRLKISDTRISGPYVDATQSGSPLVVDVMGTTVNFLLAPEESDLDRLISLITPSNDPYENNDDIMIGTLLRQRKKGSVLRMEVSQLDVRVSDLEQMKTFEALGAELARLSKVTKYLPDDDRPGLLSLASVENLNARIAINEQLGEVSLILNAAAMAHVGVPALLAAEVGQALVKRDDEVLVHDVVKLHPQDQLPAIMLRMVGDEMEPMIKAKLFNVCAEYRVSTVMAALGLSEAVTADDIALGIASSVATITGAASPKTLSRQSSQASSPSTGTVKPLQIDVLLRDCGIGLNPRKSPSKGLFVLTEAHIAGKQVKAEYSIKLDLRKASMHAIDDVVRLEEITATSPRPSRPMGNWHLQRLHECGYVSLSSIAAASILVNILGDGKDQPQVVNVEFQNELFVLESCADSTQTLIAILNGLQPPLPPSSAEKYRSVVPLQQMMQSFTGDAFATDEDPARDDFMDEPDLVITPPTELRFGNSRHSSRSVLFNEELGDDLLGEDDLDALATPPLARQNGGDTLLESFQERFQVSEAEKDFDFSEGYFEDPAEDRKGKARKWDSAKNQYHLSNEFKVSDSPLKVCIRDMNIIWNLYDGYDWPRTRGIISQAVDDVEARAEERRRKPRDEDEEENFVEEDFLFNSVWISVPLKDEKGALARQINRDIDDLTSETGSYATSTATRSTGATTRPRSGTKSKRRLRLERSKRKKIAFSLMGVSVDLVVFPPDSGETINSIDVRVQDLEIFDHVPTSTWKKFITCQIDPKQRQIERPMVNLNLLTVKPVTDLAASELVIKVSLLPLRLHVDQDALDFITRFFEFKDEGEATPASTAGEQPFIQRLEVMAVQMKLDYKPKRVDYRGLRSGHTTEFKNFLILDGSDIVLRHAIVYGITSFDKLHKTLNDVWVPDVISNQLPGVLSGLAAVRPLVNVGSGLRDLVVVPMREYKKDGRIVRSLQKGVYAFAKNTTSEVARLGAKVAIGTQNILEGAEAFLNPQTGSPSRQSHHEWDGEDPSSDTEEPRAVSHYANQPIGVRAGIRSAVRHIERDMLTARDAVIAIPAEVMEEGSGVGVAKALARHAPTVILRPALGATKAISNALLGVGNALDESSQRKIEDKYKSY